MDTDQIQDAYTDWDLYERNTSVLTRRAPAIQSFLESRRCDYTLRQVDDGIAFLDANGDSVLPLPEPQYSEQRVQMFESQAIVLTAFRPLEHVSLEAPYWLDNLQTVRKVTDQNFWRRAPDKKTAMTCLVVDLSSTEGLMALIDGLPELDILVYCISDINLFIAALHVVNWPEIFRTVEKRNTEIWIRLLSPGRDGLRESLQYLRRASRMLPDNIPVYIHKDSITMKEFGRSLLDEFTASTYGVGFFRDEVIMLENSMVNILDHGRPLLQRQPAHQGTALVVGSGPSLDDTMETVRTLSETCFVIACGTAVEPLLSQGIRVDVCVILERGLMVKTVFDRIAERVDLSTVVMVASSTVNHEVERHFARSVYFFRPGLNVSEGFGGGKSHHVLQGCDPTVSNTGISVAEYLGFRRMILFGVDVGSVDKAKHHSNWSAYYVDKMIKDVGGVDFSAKTRGAFGGKVYTNWIFDWTRARLEDFATVFDQLFILNVSDGGMIPSVTPLMPANGPLLTQVFPVARPMDPPVTVLDEPFDMMDYAYDPDEWDRYMNTLSAVCVDLSWANRQQIVMSLNNLLWADEATHPFQKLVRGSVTHMVSSAFSVLMRMETAQQQEHEPELRAAVLAGIASMQRELNELLRFGIHALPPDAPARQ